MRQKQTPDVERWFTENSPAAHLSTLYVPAAGKTSTFNLEKTNEYKNDRTGEED